MEREPAPSQVVFRGRWGNLRGIRHRFRQNTENYPKGKTDAVETTPMETHSSAKSFARTWNCFLLPRRRGVPEIHTAAP